MACRFFAMMPLDVALRAGSIASHPAVSDGWQLEVTPFRLGLC
jgi:hypothetical protein